MNKGLITIIIVLLLIPSVFASQIPWPAYCEHQGYVYVFEGDTKEYCIFSEHVSCEAYEKCKQEAETKGFPLRLCNLYEKCKQDLEKFKRCDAKAFLDGTCGQEYVKEIACRQKGEVVFPQFEKCCAGLEPQKGLIGQPSCIEKLSFFQKLWKWIVSIF